ncbi:hypothetical protein CYMTET_34378 [Cymbomonas tetramitiformis]|uniref:Uncharacterized protein n=1 Tax=Cymbomonas tetramitiformis TaxID=36881 RepID=A0AAE0KQ89_9CHLO|nr:hypothetical protein CYMTET_34378 [Cymbomonas tetramitiformis]
MKIPAKTTHLRVSNANITCSAVSQPRKGSTNSRRCALALALPASWILQAAGSVPGAAAITEEALKAREERKAYAKAVARAKALAN